MTTASFVLILAVLVLGGLIATVGDRIGTRVGKSRLSLFKMRPRKTATLVTILTGTIISACTFGILFTASEQLRTGVFELEKIEKKLRKSRVDLDRTRSEKEDVEEALDQAKSAQIAARKQLTKTQQQLQEINQALTGTQQQLTEANRSLTAANVERSQAQAEAVRKQAELSQTRSQLRTVYEQAASLRSDINQLQTERDQVIAQRDEAVRSRELVIQQKEAKLQDLEAQQEYLTLVAQRLQQETQGLRVGSVAIERGQALASGVVRIVNATAARNAVDQLLQEANRQAVQRVRPGSKEQIIQITNGEVDALMKQIGDGKEYVVRIFAAANYLVGETPIKVFSNAIRNRAVLQPGDVVASTTLDPSTMSDREIQQRLSLLISAANFRARNLGVITNSVEIIGQPQNLLTFVNQLRQSKQMTELKAVATETTYTAGPLKVELIAEQNGEVLFRTQNQTPAGNQPTSQVTP